MSAGLPWKTIFEVNALPSLELAYTYPSFSSNHGLRAKLVDRERYCLQRADSLLTVSRVTAETLSSIAGRPLSVIPNSPHPAFFEAHSSPNSTRIGYFGSLHSWQGVETALDALALLAPSYPEIVLEIVSGSRHDLRKAVRKRAHKNGLSQQVVLREGMPVSQLASVVSQWWFSLAPMLDTPRNTIQGCCPVKIVESMAAKTPVIASDLRVVSEIISHEDDGLLVRPGCARSLASAMQRMLHDQKTRERLATNGRAKVAEQFGREQIHRRLREFFNKSLTV